MTLEVVSLRAVDGSTPPVSVEKTASELTELLVARARTGDVQAWSRLYQEHFDALFEHLRYLTGNAQAAEELVSETFVQALTCIDRYDGRARFSTWLHGIALNLARHLWRSQRNARKAFAGLSAVQEINPRVVTATPDRALLARQRVAALYEALETLPEHLREAFILREIEGLPVDEAAAQLGISSNNLLVRASRARARIRKQLTRMGVTLSPESEG